MHKLDAGVYKFKPRKIFLRVRLCVGNCYIAVAFICLCILLAGFSSRRCPGCCVQLFTSMVSVTCTSAMKMYADGGHLPQRPRQDEHHSGPVQRKGGLYATPAKHEYDKAYEAYKIARGGTIAPRTLQEQANDYVNRPAYTNQYLGNSLQLKAEGVQQQMGMEAEMQLKAR